MHQVSDTLFGVARRILRDPGLAEDVLQNALVTIWRKLPHLRDVDRFDAWSFRILVHACYADAPRNRRWASTVRVLPLERPDSTDDFSSFDDRDELDDNVVDVLQPEGLVYSPGPDGKLKLVAVEYVVPGVFSNPPGVSVAPIVFGREMVILVPAVGFYTLHAWIWSNNPAGLFAHWSPEVSCA